ncbi:MAG: hypothetical protein E7095_10035 [Bacteroides sp.]|nr:hypothetical protein [Bacteroides sp.]
MNTTEFNSFTLKEIKVLKRKKETEIKASQKKIINHINNILKPSPKEQPEKDFSLLSNITTGLAIFQGIWEGINFIQKIKKFLQRKH